MAKAPSHNRPNRQPTHQNRAPSSSQVGSSPGFAIGAILILVAIGACVALVANHFNALSLPGCRPGGACEQAAASRWGKVPGTGWPVSFVGLAYFLGLFVAWVASRGTVTGGLRALVRLGGLLSILYIIILIAGRHACYYCIATHAANLAFWLLVETRSRPIMAVGRPVFVIAVIFLLASATLGAVEYGGKKREGARQEKELAESTQQIIQAATQPTAAQQSTSITPGAAPDAIARPWKGGFTGRYLRGPKDAPIRVVILTDYQCPDCKRTEADVERVLKSRPDVSLSIKHFPFCKDCNPTLDKSLHPNACWAARAAETAGILKGNDGFWQMHDWLFAHSGSFTNEEFTKALTEMNYEVSEFTNLMMSKAPLDLVESDVQEGIWLGLHYTPMVFINGVELKGVFVPDAVTRAVHEISLSNPKPASAEDDQPPPAATKYVTDWQQNPFQHVGQDPQSWPMGKEGAKLHIVIWGDYQEPYTAKADKWVREFIAGRNDAQYVFRHYPIDQTCNPSSQLTKHPLACLAAKAAEAAGVLYGIDGYWRMHEWLMDNQTKLSEQTLRTAAQEMGFLPDALFVTMESPQVAQAIIDDAKYAKSLGLYSLPYIFVNGRFVPRWSHNEERIINHVMEAALKEQPRVVPPNPTAATAP